MDDQELAEIMAMSYSGSFSKAAPRAAGASVPVAATAARTVRPGFFSEAGRVIAGGVRDAAQGSIDTFNDIDTAVSDWADRKMGLGTYALYGRNARNGVIELVSKDRWRQATGEQDALNARLPAVAENQTVAGQVGRDIAEFGTSFVTFSKQLKGLEALGSVAKWGKPVVAGALAAFVDIEPMEGNLLNLADQLGVPRNAVIEALAVEEDDGAIEARLKNASTDAVAGLAFDAGIKALTFGVRAVRGAKKAKSSLEGQAAVPEEALKHAPELDAEAARAVDEVFAPKAAAEAAPKAAPEVAPGTQQSLFDDLPPAAKPAQVDELEEALFAIPSKMQGLSDEAVQSLARSYHEGSGYEVLQRLGLNPARIDFAKVLAEGESAEKVAEMVERIAEAVQPLAMQAGSKPRSWSQTQMLANLLGGTESQVVASFKGATNLLDAKAWAARQFLGGSAARLTRLAELARDHIDAPGSPQYVEFLKALEAHAALQAQFKAATSNLGRALNSLKGTATAKEAVERARRLRDLNADPKDATGSGKGVKTAEDALRALGDAKTPAERRRLIEKIIKAKGDTAALTKLAARYQGPARWQRATREFITGALFGPGTAVVNVVSTAGHIFMRALARLPVHALAYASGKAGGREYVAMRVADTAYLTTVIPGFARGFTQAAKLFRDEFTEELQGLAGSFGSNKAERGLAQARKWMDEKMGAFTPRFERPDAERSKEWRISKDTVDALMDDTDQLPALMRIGMRGLVGLASGAFNAVGASSRIVRMVTIDMTDELMGAVSEQATRAATAARIAALEGYDRGLSGDNLAKYVRQRADVLLQHNSDELMEQIERLVALGAKEDSDEVMTLAAEAARALDIKELGQAEARKVLFQDDLNWRVSQTAAKFLPELDAHTGVIFPFIKTPLKIMETTLGDYTPLGLLQKETRDRLYSGGIDAQITLSQIALGTTVVGTAVAWAAAGNIVGYDGGPRSPNRLHRPAYSMRVGDRWIEYGRMEPLGLILGFGADLHEYQLHADQAEEGEGPSRGEIEKAIAGMMFAFGRNILSKTWMTTMRELVGAAGAETVEQSESMMERLLTVTVQKAVPMGGVMRWWEGENHGVTREAVGMWEKIVASTPWSDTLPVRRDTLLGRPIEYNRVGGIQAGWDPKDPLLRELGDLPLQLPPNSRKYMGVELSSAQMARLKELRGQVVEDTWGYTLEGKLRELVTSPEWQELDPEQRAKAVTGLRQDYHSLAIDALREEDREFDHAVGSVQLRRKLEKKGWSQPEISAELELFRKEVLGQ